MGSPRTRITIPVPPPTSVDECIGRDDELKVLADLYQNAQRGGFHLALISGPNGVGKTTLVRAFRSNLRLQGGVSLEGYCQPGLAFGPFAEIVEQATRFLQEVGVTPEFDESALSCRLGCHSLWHEHEGAENVIKYARKKDSERRLRFFQAIFQLLASVATVRPPTIVLHDLEHADQGTLQLIEYIAQSSDVWSGDGNDFRGLIVASLRKEENETSPALAFFEENANHIRLGALTEEQTRIFLSQPHFAQKVWLKSQGNPEAIVRILDATPEDPRSAIRRRLSALPTEQRILLETLSTLQRPASLELLESLTAIPALEETCEALVDRFLRRHRAGGRMRYTFTRRVDKERVYQGLAVERRDALHRRTAEELRSVSSSESATHHAIQAKMPDLAERYALEDADSLTARHAFGEAAILLEEVVVALDSPPLSLRKRLVDCYRVVGDYRPAIIHAQVILEQKPESAHAAKRVGELMMLAGQHEDAVSMFALAENLSDDEDLRAEVNALRAETHLLQVDYEACRKYASDALGIALAAENTNLEIKARNTLGKLDVVQGNFESAKARFSKNRDIAEVHEHKKGAAQALSNLGLVMLYLKDKDAARHFFTEAATLSREEGDLRDESIAIENLAVLAHQAREYPEALVRYHEALELLKRLGNRVLLSRAATNLGELYLSLGAVALAKSLENLCLRFPKGTIPSRRYVNVLTLSGRVALAENEPERAIFNLDRAYEIATRFQRPEINLAELVMDRAQARILLGDIPAASQILRDEGPDAEGADEETRLALLQCEIRLAEGALQASEIHNLAARAMECSNPSLKLRTFVYCAKHLSGKSEQIAMSYIRRAISTREAIRQTIPHQLTTSWLEKPELVELDALSAFTDSQEVSLDEPETVALAALNAPSKLAQNLVEIVRKISPSDATVVIRGESGVGKELVAEAIYQLSNRSDAPFVKVNCAALVETLLMSELFGHEKGAFTGATTRKKGRFELADGGTLFLDEIGDISPQTQVALLRVLQEREFERVGGTKAIQVNVRIITATHRNLEEMVERGEFREDLYYRLRGVVVEVPALRERTDDIPFIAEGILSKIARERGVHALSITPDALKRLAAHHWRGNIRELENTLRSATLFCEGNQLVASDFDSFPEFREKSAQLPTFSHASMEDLVYDTLRGSDFSLAALKKNIEKECIVRAMEESDGNITRAAELLGMKRPRLSQLVKQYEIRQIQGKS